MGDSGCAGPAVVDLILFCRAGFNLPCSFLSPLCLLTALRLPRRSQRESANRGDAQTALRAGLQTPSPSLPASLSGSGCWSVSAAGVHSQGFLGTFHSSSVVSSLRLQCCCPVLLWAGSVHVLGMCVSTLQLCTGSLAASFYQLLSGSFSLCLGCFLTALLPQQHSFTTPHSVCFWRVFNAGQQKKANSNETAKLIAKFLLASSPRVTDRERSSVGLQARVLAGGHSTIFEPTVTCCCTLMK